MLAALSSNPPLKIHDDTFGGVQDGSLAVLDPTTSSLLYFYFTYFGGGGNEYMRGPAIDAAGNAHVAGETASADLPWRPAYQQVLNGLWDLFVAKLDTTVDGDASLIYSTYLGGTGNERINFDNEPTDAGKMPAIDAKGRAYVTGTTNPPDYPLAMPIDENLAGAFAAAVSLLGPTGSSLTFSTYWGGNDGSSNGLAVAADAEGNAHVVGRTDATNLVVEEPFQGSSGGGADAFLSEMQPLLPCASSVVDVPGLHTEVDALNTSQTTKDTLNLILDRVEELLNTGRNAKARIRLGVTFNEGVIRASNLIVTDPTNANLIPLDEANSLICGGANVMNTIPLP